MTIRRVAPSRREVLALGGAGMAALVLVACGDDGGTTSTTVGKDRALAQFFGGGPQLAAGVEARAPFGVADADGLLPIEDTPEQLEVTIVGADGKPVGDPVTVDRHAKGLPQAYYPLRFTVAAPGIYTAKTTIDGVPAEMSMKVDAPADLAVVQAGEAMPSVVTPTTAAAAGVDPICTDDPVCDLHSVSLDAALSAGTAVALLVSTPAYCQVKMCGPVLAILRDQVSEYADVRFIHAEVYAHPETDPQLQDHAPIIDALGLHFEPCLVLVHADGTVAERLDNVYDEDELVEALDRLTAPSQ
jgi:hypothetical protein